MKVTNNSKALQGVNGKSGRVFIRPDETKDVEFDDVGLKQARRLKFLTVGKAKADAEPQAPADDTPAKSPAEVLAMFSDPNVEFFTAKAEAKKVLGDSTPSKKDDIIKALEELATQP